MENHHQRSVGRTECFRAPRPTLAHLTKRISRNSEISSQNVDLKVKSNLTKRRAVDRLKIGDLAGGIFNGGLVIRKQYGGLV